MGAAEAGQQRFGVPASLLEAICYLEGQLSDHGGAPSVAGGYGCMNLARNNHLDSLDQAAKLLAVPVSSVRGSQRLNILGAAAVLRADALSLSGTHRVPATLGGWYAAIAKYSGARHDVAVLYANEVYRILGTGLTATAPSGEVVRIAPSAVTPDTASAATVGTTTALPANCTSNPGTDYTPAYNCIVPTSYAGVTYNTANRPSDLPLLGITIHDTEETLDNTIAIFWDRSRGVSIHYVVDTDGTVYQCLHEKDIAFQNGNYWYNQRTMGIEHVGVDATGYQWYNATEYLGSAKLSAYLLTKYSIPLDHEHVMSHGTTPSPTLGSSPNHVDPGPYWLWNYYLSLINQQGVPFAGGHTPAGVIRLNPPPASSPTVPAAPRPPPTSTSSPSQPTLDGIRDAAVQGSAVTSPMRATTSRRCSATTPWPNNPTPPAPATPYTIWYRATLSTSNWTATGTKAWIAAPPGSAEQGYGTVVTPTKGKAVTVYGQRGGTSSSVPHPAVGLPLTLERPGLRQDLYAINYNHRQGYPATEVSATAQPTAPAASRKTTQRSLLNRRSASASRGS